MPRRPDIAALLRERIERGLETRALIRGDRLPSTREMARELDADPRVVMKAYRKLTLEGLVEIRVRSGVYVSRHTLELRGQRPPNYWLAGVLTEGVDRGLSTRDFCDYLREAALTRKVRAVVITKTFDQTAGIARELRADYGLEVAEMLGGTVRKGASVPYLIKQANFIVTTTALDEPVSALAHRLGKPCIVATIRQQLIGDDLLGILQREAFVIARDPRFLTLLRDYLRGVPGGDNVTMLVAGRDSLSEISPDSPTYVTEAARAILGKTRLPGRVLPPARVFAADCVREILRIIVDLNASA